MITHSRPATADSEELTVLIARRDHVTKTMVRPFADFVQFTAELLKTYYRPGGRLISIGHVHPAMEMAADRADLRVTEVISKSPFASCHDSATRCLTKPEDILYISNPNRVTGTGHSLEYIEHLVENQPHTALLIDEAFFDYYVVSSLPLVQDHQEVIVLRSFGASFGIASTDAGYAVSHPSTTRTLREIQDPSVPSSALRQTVRAAVSNRKILVSGLKALHTETLRLTHELRKLDIQIQLSSTDFFLMRVADPKEVGNHLAGWQVPIDNLDGYPGLRHYVRYRVQSRATNNRFLSALQKMPKALYKMTDLDRREVTLRRNGEDSRAQSTKPIDANRFREPVELT